MKTRQLGNSSLHLSEIGFGAWAIGGDNWAFGWGPQDDKQSVEAMHHALELGINWIDTAAVYGLGHSEELVSKVIADHRDSVIVASKCSLIWNEEREVSSSLKAESVLKECEASLKRLNTDYIDLYQIHWPNDDERIEEGWEAVSRLVEQGKIRYGGVSNFQVSHMKRAQAIHPITSLQPPYSMLRRQGEQDGEFDYCSENNIGIVAYSPMQSGLLSGKFDISRVAENDWRKKSKEFNEPNLSINLEFADKLKPVAQKYDKTVAQLAIAWVLRQEVVTAAIAGARNPKQIEETVGGADWKIDEADLSLIDTLLARREQKLNLL